MEKITTRVKEIVKFIRENGVALLGRAGEVIGTFLLGFVCILIGILALMVLWSIICQLFKFFLLAPTAFAILIAVVVFVNRK